MKSISLYSPEAPKGWLPWGAFAPFLCILLVAIPADLVASSVLEHFHFVNAKGDPIGLTGLFLFLLFPFTLMGLAFWGWIRFVERRPLTTIGLVGPHRIKSFLIGLVIGFVTISMVVAAIWMAGGFTTAGVGMAFRSPKALLSTGFLLLCFALQASVEEFIFRGWLLSVEARKFNVPIAVFLTSAVFTFLHFSPRQHWATTTGVFLFSAFACAWALRAGNIWGVMGWHAGWNWLLAVGFELPVTGLDTGLPALLVKLNPRGSVLLTGGTQGPEGSIWCSVFFIVAIIYLRWRGRRSLPSMLSTQEVA